MSSSPALLLPRTLEEAQAQLHRTPEARVLAGGQSLVPAWRSSGLPPAVLSLDRIESLRGVHMEGDSLQLGAQTTLHELATSALVRRQLPALARMAARMGDCFMRNRATVTGAACSTSGAGCLPAAMLACGATVHTTARTISAEQWFAPPDPTAGLQRGELVVRLAFPIPEVASHQCLRLTPARFAAVTVFATRGARGFGVGVSGLGERSLRSLSAEAWLAAGEPGDERTIAAVFDGLPPHAGADTAFDYRVAQARRLLRSAAVALARPRPTF